MARKKLSEWRAKKILTSALEIPYHGVSCDFTATTNSLVKQLDPQQTYVVKVDEGVKKRMKHGLVALNKKPTELSKAIQTFHKKGYTQMIIEPYIPHESSSEKYLSLERTREGIVLLYSEKGGIDIEENQNTLTRVVLSSGSEKISEELSSISFFRDDKGKDFLKKLLHCFDAYYFSFLEINPLVVEKESYYLLDVAAEVDSAAAFFVHDAWTTADIRTGLNKEKTDEEKEIDALAQKSQASFKLDILNPDGSLFMLLSGGGASIVLADEVYNLGFGKQLANYGEYSGNPKAEEVYLYTKQLLQLLLRSHASRKVLVIGGGVANFTDIRRTFEGILSAIDEKADALQKQHVEIFVRRGGPHQAEGLALMETFLREKKLLGIVADQRTTLPEVVRLAIEKIQ